MSRVRFIILLGMALAACAGTPVPTALPSATPTPAPKRVLFINGNFIPESGYPHSRVTDDGKTPESFSRLRAEVLESDLHLAVDEMILTGAAAITPEILKNNAVVVLGSNNRHLRPAEVDALQNYYAAGGSLLFYADFQYGPDNWASDNDFLTTQGIEVLPDNFQPRTKIAFAASPHPIAQNIKQIEVEGISQFLISDAAQKNATIIATCSPLERSGCALQPNEQARVKAKDVVACVFVQQNGAGRLAGLCDRNLFHNGPQKDGTDLNQADNLIFAKNLFGWLARK